MYMSGCILNKLDCRPSPITPLCRAAPASSHLPLDKMAAILADDTFKCIFLNENDRIPIQI